MCDGTVEIVIGVFFRPKSWESRYFEREKLFRKLRFEGRLPLRILMPFCGTSYEYYKREDIELVDVGCRCGDSNHYAVKWEEEDE